MMNKNIIRKCLFVILLLGMFFVVVDDVSGGVINYGCQDYQDKGEMCRTVNADRWRNAKEGYLCNCDIELSMNYVSGQCKPISECKGIEQIIEDASKEKTNIGKHLYRGEDISNGSSVDFFSRQSWGVRCKDENTRCVTNKIGIIGNWVWECGGKHGCNDNEICVASRIATVNRAECKPIVQITILCKDANKDCPTSWDCVDGVCVRPLEFSEDQVMLIYKFNTKSRNEKHTVSYVLGKGIERIHGVNWEIVSGQCNIDDQYSNEINIEIISGHECTVKLHGYFLGADGSGNPIFFDKEVTLHWEPEPEQQTGTKCDTGQKQCNPNNNKEFRVCTEDGKWGDFEDCNEGKVCRDGDCVDEEEEKCDEEKNPCPDGQICKDGECVTPTIGMDECGEGAYGHMICRIPNEGEKPGSENNRCFIIPFCQDDKFCCINDKLLYPDCKEVEDNVKCYCNQGPKEGPVDDKSKCLPWCSTDCYALNEKKCVCRSYCTEDVPVKIDGSSYAGRCGKIDNAATCIPLGGQCMNDDACTKLHNDPGANYTDPKGPIEYGKAYCEAKNSNHICCNLKTGKIENLQSCGAICRNPDGCTCPQECLTRAGSNLTSRNVLNGYTCLGHYYMDPTRATRCNNEERDGICPPGCFWWNDLDCGRDSNIFSLLWDVAPDSWKSWYYESDFIQGVMSFGLMFDINHWAETICNPINRRNLEPKEDGYFVSHDTSGWISGLVEPYNETHLIYTKSYYINNLNEDNKYRIEIRGGNIVEKYPRQNTPNATLSNNNYWFNISRGQSIQEADIAFFDERELNRICMIFEEDVVFNKNLAVETSVKEICRYLNVIW